MNIDEYIEQRNALNALLKNDPAGVLESLFKPVFETGEIKNVWWYQYTPSWNDGDPCTFTLGDPRFNGTEEDPEDTSIWRYSDEWDELSNETQAAVYAFEKKFEAIEAVLETAFGDHAQVLAFEQDGKLQFKVDEYRDW